MTDSKLVEIVVVLDRSGSMQDIKDDTIGGYNSFLEEQKRVKDSRCKVTLVQFDNEYLPVYGSVDVQEVEALNADTYVPRASTALFDAIGRTINETGARLAAMSDHERPGKVIFVIITDGYENSSREFTSNRVKSMIAEQETRYSWSFVFLGADQDSFQADGLGLGGGKFLSYGRGRSRDTFAAMGQTMSDYRGMSKSAQSANQDSIGDLISENLNKKEEDS